MTHVKDDKTYPPAPCPPTPEEVERACKAKCLADLNYEIGRICCAVKQLTDAGIPAAQALAVAVQVAEHTRVKAGGGAQA